MIPLSSLVPQLLIDYIFQRLAFLEALKLGDEELHCVVEPVRGVVGAVG